MSNKKPGRKAKVTLDAKTVLHIESSLRKAFAGVGAAYDMDAKKMKMKTSATVHLDPATVARFTEHLRQGLVQSGAIYDHENVRLNLMTKKVKKTRSK
ncbi:MAG: hypothetical protein WBN92_01915 [Terriglobia bacterium]